LWGCSILCEKIKKQWLELNEDQRAGMVRILRTQLKGFTAANCFPLVTKACISVSWVAIHSIRTNEWPGFFEEMASLTTNQITRDDNPNQIIPMDWTYLELMKTLADETKNAPHMDPALQKTAMTFLRENASQVLHTCHTVLKTTQILEVRDQAIQAINAWVELDPRTTDDIFQVLETLVQAALAYPTAITDLAHVLEAIQSCMSNTNLHRYPTALAAAIRRVAELGIASERCLEEDDEDSLSAFCSFLVYISESHSGTMIANPEPAQKICSIVCQLSQSVDLPLVVVLAEFWQHFLLELGAQKDLNNVPGGAESYRQTVLESIRILHQRSQFSSLTPSADETSEVNAVRDNAGESFLLAYSQLFGDECLQLFCQVLDADLHGCEDALTTNPAAYNSRCRAVEATLYFLARLTENIPDSESKFMPLILEMLTRVPNDVEVQRTALTFIGSLGPWLSFQCKEHAEYGGKVASYIIPSLVDENLSQRASEAMRDLAKEVPEALLPHLGGLLGAIQNSLFQMPATRRSTVIHGLALVISLLDFQVASNLFLEISKSLCVKMQAICESGQQNGEQQDALCLEIRSLGQACVSSSSPGDHPFLASFRFSWPMLEQIAVHFKHVEPVRRVLLKATYRFLEAIPRDQLRDCLRNILNIYIEFTRLDPMNPPIRETVLLISRFQTRPEGGMSRAAADPSLVYTNQQDIADISSSVETIVRTVFQAASLMEGFNPRALGGVFDLVHFSCKRMPDCLCRNQDFFMYILNSGISALLTTLDKAAFESARRLLHGLYTFDDSVWRPMLVDGLAQGFHPLLTTLLQAIGGAVPRSYLNDVSGLLASLLTRYPNELKSVASNLLSQDAFPSKHVTVEDKKAFLEQLFRYANNREALGKVLHAFSGKCLGLKSAS
jgi:hypothetical protein